MKTLACAVVSLVLATLLFAITIPRLGAVDPVGGKRKPFF